ncbi:MAG: TDP-N-acetylfucosamine:lipid II N-acetylfucosaminyltransferase [Bacteroidales bacterium]
MILTFALYLKEMYLHIFANQTAYSWALLNLLEKEINIEKHIFVFGIGNDHPMDYPYSPNLQKHILYLKRPKQLVKILNLIYKADWIYIHLLAYDPTLFFWCLNRKLIKKSTWVVWGSDIYAFQKKQQSLRTRIYERLRQSIIPRFSEIAAFVPEDFDIIASVYGSTARYIPILYPLPVNLVQLNDVKNELRKGSLTVMIGNSGDQTNNHCEMIDLLSVFSNENMKVVCPLAYGGSQEYRELVISKGISTFGDNFIPWLEMKNKQEYAEQLAVVDISIMNHKRQQGLGNILALLYLGKKVFLREEVSSYSFLKRNNCSIYPVESLKRLEFTEFCKPIEEKETTISNVGNIMQEDYTANLWKNLLKQH